MGLSKRADENKIISKKTLLRIYKQFKKTPLKVFLLKDFFPASPKNYRGKYLNTLISLGLIEEVSAVYLTGKNYKTRREIKGYKFINKT